MKKASGSILGALLVAVAVIAGLVIWHHHNHNHHYKATCWNPVYATTHNPNHISPPPRHGRSATVTDSRLCYGTIPK